MLDLQTLERMRLTARPRVQELLGWTVLYPNYRLPPRVEIEFEHVERLPDEPVIYAMNHTDRYNYWPFQFRLWRSRGRFTTTWVKGKYYENRWIGRFMEATNNIPTVSRGYLLSKDFQLAAGRTPRTAEYEALRHWVDAAALDRALPPPELELPRDLLAQPRNTLGIEFRPGTETWAAYINRLFERMMRRFVELNEEGFAKGLDLIVFPQGTRSKRLSRGHPGLAQIALRYRKTIQPIGCSGSDRCYPGSSPIAKGGHITYRFGEPIRWQDLREFHIDEDYEPFSPEAESRHRECFQGLVDLVMGRINDLVEPEYRFPENGQDKRGAAQGADRFL